jgi:hypothetical protein
MHQRSRTQPTLATASSICTLRVALPLANPRSAAHYWHVHAFPPCPNRAAACAPHDSYNQANARPRKNACSPLRLLLDKQLSQGKARKTHEDSFAPRDTTADARTGARSTH